MDKQSLQENVDLVRLKTRQRIEHQLAELDEQHDHATAPLKAQLAVIDECSREFLAIVTGDSLPAGSSRTRSSSTLVSDVGRVKPAGKPPKVSRAGTRKARSITHKGQIPSTGRLEEELWIHLAARLGAENWHMDQFIESAESLGSDKSKKQMTRKVQAWVDMGLVERLPRPASERASYRFTPAGCAKYGLG